MKWPDARRSLRFVRMTVVLVVGGTIVLLGCLMVFTPGPALLVIPAGLAILATEFAWARRWLKMAREKAESMANSMRGKGAKEAAPGSEPPPDAPPPNF